MQNIQYVSILCAMGVHLGARAKLAHTHVEFVLHQFPSIHAIVLIPVV